MTHNEFESHQMRVNEGKYGRADTAGLTCRCAQCAAYRMFYGVCREKHTAYHTEYLTHARIDAARSAFGTR